MNDPHVRDTSDAAPAAESCGALRLQELSVIEHLMAGGQILSAQVSTSSKWTPEKRLAGAVLASALVEIRDHHGDSRYERRTAEDLEWVQSDDVEWPFSFVRLCALFELDTAWVREVVARWVATPLGARTRPGTPYRQAA
jgi:hypothetical protein